MRRRDRGQRGFTLVELLLGMVVSAAIVVPLLAWMVLGWDQQTKLTHLAQDDTGTNLVETVLPHDMASAYTVSSTGTDCAPMVATPTTTTIPVPSAGPQLPAASAAGSPASPRNAAVVLVVQTGSEALGARVVYSVEDADDGSGTLRRRSCDGGSNTDQGVVLATGLRRPAAGWSAIVRCELRYTMSSTDRDSESCGRAILTLTGRSGSVSSVTASMRTGTYR